MKLALAMIVKGSDGEAEVLARCLKNVSPHVDGMFITITQPNKKVEEVAKLFGATISHFEWCNDFAKARNFNFSQVTKDFDYILWLDADDVLEGVENLKTTIESNPADVYVFNYIYSLDKWGQPNVVHLKSQVVRNDQCVQWEGNLHEDFKSNRQLNSYLVKDITRVHLSNHERFEAAKERNLQVAEKQFDINPDDPRSYWNLGNALKAKGENVKAIDAFNKFLEMSKSEEEKYIVRLRLAEIHWDMGNKERALDEVRFAIGLRPNYPDGYINLGRLLMLSDRFAEAAEMILTSFTKKPAYYSIIVYNPREYDYMPLMMLANIYFLQKRPDLALPCLEGCLKITPGNESLKNTVETIRVKAEEYNKIVKKIARLKKITDKEKLKQSLSRLPDEIKSHPLVCHLRNTNFIKTESSGKDVVFFCGYTEKEWNPDIARDYGVGGSEEAVIWMAELLAEKGFNVSVYNNCGHKEKKYGKVKYLPFWAWNYRDKQDVVVLWRVPYMLDYDINSPKVIVDLHDVIQPGEFNDRRIGKIYKVFFKSNFHRSLFPNIPEDKVVVVPNGIDYKLFNNRPEKELLMIHTSSPDRGLKALVELYPEIKKQVPGVRCQWAYGWDIWDVIHKGDAEKSRWKDEVRQKMKEVGIEELGRVSHGKVAEMYLKAKVFAYPSEFAEIDCISLTKALASKAIPVTTDFAAMGEKSGHGGYFIKSSKTKDNWCQPNQYDFSITNQKQKQEWVEKVVKALKEEAGKEMAQFAEGYDWKNILEIWLKYI